MSGLAKFVLEGDAAFIMAEAAPVLGRSHSGTKRVVQLMPAPAFHIGIYDEARKTLVALDMAALCAIALDEIGGHRMAKHGIDVEA